MKAVLKILLCCLMLGCFSRADIYLHYPRGSNNRLDEKSATRANGNRLFDSQNNARGGYNKGVLKNKDFEEEYFYSTQAGQSAFVNVEWTMQHGCNDGTARCRVVIQAMCQDEDVSTTSAQYLRNGASTETQQFAASPKDEVWTAFLLRRNNSVSSTRGLHEPFEWYDACASRERNHGLNSLDQNLKGKTAIYTRQNPNGNRRGYECPEERDYYPYWHPTPWLDIGILTDNTSECECLANQAVSEKHLCVEQFPSKQRRWAVADNNEFDCAKHGGQFLAFKSYLEIARDISDSHTCTARGYIWGLPFQDKLDSLDAACLVPLPKPVCKLGPWTRDNHLGDKVGGGPAAFSWEPPHFPSGRSKRCVLRLRYNLTSNDPSDLRNNPLIQPGLRLAVNTAQVGRVFQDRSHVFRLSSVPSSWGAATVHHVGVRGKRGNIVQVYPAVEYDFTPTRVAAKVGDLVVMQWSGSDTHNNNAPGGDGDTGADGTGSAGSDRNNLLQTDEPGGNFPLPFEHSDFFSTDSLELVRLWPGHSKYSDVASMSMADVSLMLASSGYYQCMQSAVCGSESAESKAVLDGDLNNAEASFPGLIFRVKKSGTYNFICTRNNNFSNRSQKFVLTVW